MRKKKPKLLAVLLSVVMCFGSFASIEQASAEGTSLTKDTEATETTEGVTIDASKISVGNFKNTKFNNPISSNFYCADPTSVEYNGRIYLFGTNDHQQYEIAGSEKDNTYEHIKSFVILSTNDMVNWVYHGEINTGEIAPWIVNSWAPSIVSRIEDDGLTHFYLYFSNNGLGVGVITATDPLGPWEDPLGKPLISSNTPGLTDCPNPFDPGVVIDENGDGWLAFGGGKASDGTTYMPGSSRIVKLGDDMLSFDSEFTEIPAPYFFEASELNYINGTYVYTYCSDWSDHSLQWDYDCEVPSACSMIYMTTKTPLDPDSWEMKGECLKNPGLSGMDYCNNHTHLQKFNDEYYIFYHTLELKVGMGITGSYRSMAVDKIEVDESTVTIEPIGGTRKGTDSANMVNPFTINMAAELNNTANITYDLSDPATPVVISNRQGAWISVKDVKFTSSPESETTEEITLNLTNIDKIKYNILVTSVEKPTTITMYPTGSSEEIIGTAEVSGTGYYSITCDMGGTNGFMNMGYFKASDDAEVTFMVDTIVINDKYEFDISSELTNTREWADGLKNIWNGFSDGDAVYTSDFAEFRFVADANLIQFFASANIKVIDPNENAPLVEDPITFLARVKGTGRIEVRLDSAKGDLLTSIDFDSADNYTTIYNSEVTEIGGIHDLYFVFSNETISMKSWEFTTETVSGNDNGDSDSTDNSVTPSTGTASPTVNSVNDTSSEKTSNKDNTATIIIVCILAIILAGAGVAIYRKKK